MNNLTDLNRSFLFENVMAFRMQRHSILPGKCSSPNMISVNYSAEPNINIANGAVSINNEFKDN